MECSPAAQKLGDGENFWMIKRETRGGEMKAEQAPAPLEREVAADGGANAAWR